MHVLQHKWVGVLSGEKDPLQQLHSKKKGVGLFSRVGLFPRDCGTCTIHAKIYHCKHESTSPRMFHASVSLPGHTLYSCGSVGYVGIEQPYMVEMRLICRLNFRNNRSAKA